MENLNSSVNLLKIIIPSGIIIALVWQFLQISFFINNWAQPGTTSLSLFSTQILFVSVLLFFCFQIFRNQFTDGFIPFGKILRLGFLIGIAVAIFGILFLQIYSNYISPNYETWIHEMYLQNWTERGLSEVEIQKQLATNNWLKTINGIIYSSFFAVGIITLISIIPALLAARPNHKNILQN